MPALRAHTPQIISPRAIFGAFFLFWVTLIGIFYAYLPVENNFKTVTPSIVSANTIGKSGTNIASRKLAERTPLALDEIISYLETWVSQLHNNLLRLKDPEPQQIWEAYVDLSMHTLLPWDKEYLQRMPERRQDGSLFLSIASYRDEKCVATLEQAFQKAKHPEKLFVGLVQQNCHNDCQTGVMEDGLTHPTNPDPDCFDTFCESEIGHEHCKAGRLRVLRMREPESLGPYMARYLASKLWYGEELYIQMDSHMTFAQDWDAITWDGMKNAPSKKPVISHYPPSHKFDLKLFESFASSRICGPMFTGKTIRLEGSQIWDAQKISTPRFAPVLGAGYLVAPSSFLREVPFDPLLPWIFNGEEILISSRLWTSGYDFFSPAQAVVGHIYDRPHQPKFWESLHRVFEAGVYEELQEIVLQRIKFELGYKEYARDMIVKSLLTGLEHYSMGHVRSIDNYLRLIGMDTTTKEITRNEWCEHGVPPPGFEKFNHLYEFQGRRQLRSAGEKLGSNSMLQATALFFIAWGFF